MISFMTSKNIPEVISVMVESPAVVVISFEVTLVMVVGVMVEDKTALSRVSSSKLTHNIKLEKRQTDLALKCFH